MSELHEQESEFSRRLERAPFDDAPRDAHRDVLREQVLSRFKSVIVSAPPRRWHVFAGKGKQLMRRPLPYAALAAACLAVGAIWLLVPGQQSTAEAFNAFAGAFVDAKSMKFQMNVAVEGQPKRMGQAYYLAPGRMRQEIDKVASIIDMRSGKLVTLNPVDKSAIVMTMKGRQNNKGPLDLFEQMRDLLAENRDAAEPQYKPIGEKEIDGRRALGFRCESPMATVTMWGDPETGLPVEIDSVFTGIPRTEVTMKDFDLDPNLDASLFDVTPPADYKVQSFDIDASPFTEADLVNALGTCSELAGGEFPEALNTTAINRVILEAVKRHGKENIKELTPKLMEKSMTIGRGFGFAFELPASADAHYAGKGVKRDAPDTPIFWYKPEGKEKYRVLYADLSLREAEQAPDVPAAVRVRKPAAPLPKEK